MLILLNKAAGGSRAEDRLKHVLPHVRDLFGSVDIVDLVAEKRPDELISQRIQCGERHFVAAGGDGTVHTVLQHLMAETNERPDVPLTLGAIGLGSSNDFHKPIDGSRCINGIPVKLDFSHAQRRDVGTCSYRTDGGAWRQRYWMVNSSIGVTAEANHFFNRTDTTPEYLKVHALSTAILLSAVRGIRHHRNRELELKDSSGRTRTISLTNLGIAKSPHFSGDLSYGTPMDLQSRRFEIHLCAGMSRPEMLMTLFRLATHSRSTSQKAQTWSDSRLEITADEPIPIEMDGEIVFGSAATFAIAENMLEVCP